MSKSEPKTVIICGAKRSGTTLIERLLDDIDHSFSFLDELFFFEYLYDIGEENVEAFIDIHRKAGAQELIDAVKKRQIFLFFEQGYSQGPGTVNKQKVPVRFEMKILEEELRQGLKLGGINTITDIWYLWVRAFCRGMHYDYQSIKAVVMKSPDYGKSVVTGNKYLFDPKIIIIVRNPYYAVDSLKRSREMRGLKLHALELINVLRDYGLLLNTIQDIECDQKKRQNTVIVKYERFLQNPKKTMRTIAGLMSIPFSNKFMKPTMNGSPWYGLSSFEKFNGISTKPSTRKIQTLNDWEIDLIKTHLQPFFRYFNYPLAIPERDNGL
jgi:hypothetical protein